MACRIGLLLILLAGTASAAKPSPSDGSFLKCGRGTITVAGRAMISGGIKGATSRGAESGFSLALQPAIGVMVIDRLELSLNLAIDAGFGERYEDFPKTFGIGFGSRYLIGTGRLLPFFRLGVSIKGLIPVEGDSEAVLDVAPGLGLAIALARNVATTLGFHTAFGFGLRWGTVDIEFPLTLLGVEGFF